MMAIVVIIILLKVKYFSKSWDSVVGIATRTGGGRSRFRIPTGARDISPKYPNRLSGSPDQRDWYRDYLQGVKRPGCLVNQSPPPNTVLKNEWSYASSPPTCLHGVDNQNFTFCIFFCDISNRCFSVVRGATGVLTSRIELHFSYEMFSFKSVETLSS